MKHVTASEARKNWFALLDEGPKGAVVAIQRNDKKLILKLQKKKAAVPNYKGQMMLSRSNRKTEPIMSGRVGGLLCPAHYRFGVGERTPAG